MNGYGGDNNAAMFVLAGAFAATLGFVFGAIAAHILTGSRNIRLSDDTSPHRPNQNVRQEVLMANAEQLPDNDEQNPVAIEQQDVGEVVGYLVLRDTGDGLISLVRDEGPPLSVPR